MEEKENTKLAPRDFDTSVKIAKSGIKFFIIGVLFLTTLVFLWGIFGKIPVKIKGKGIIVKQEYENIITSNYPGVVSNIFVEIGDTVHTGDKLVKLEQFELSQKLIEKLFYIKRTIDEDSLNIVDLHKNLNNRLQEIYNEKQQVVKSMELQQNKVAYFEKLLNDKRELADKGIISKNDYKQTKFQYKQTQVELNKTQNKLEAITVKESQINTSTNLQVTKLNSIIANLKLQKQELLKKSQKYSHITSAFEGIVQEIMAKEDVLVGAGEKLFTISGLSNKTKLEVDFFLAYNSLQQANVNMDAVVAPYNVDKNRFGQIKAKVTYVSNYPASKEFISKTINNDDFVNLVSQHGPVYFAKVTLTPNIATVSGLQWTSFDGAPYRIKPGTICETEVYVDYVPPLSFVIPWFKKLMSNDN
jgi:HlyD family secretion protein